MSYGQCHVPPQSKPRERSARAGWGGGGVLVRVVSPYAEEIMGWNPTECHPVLRLLDDSVNPGGTRQGMDVALFGCCQDSESVAPNYREAIIKFPDSTTWSEGPRLRCVYAFMRGAWVAL